MIWDSREMYLYLRLTKENRIIAGKDTLITLLNPKPSQSLTPVHATIQAVERIFPQLQGLEFEYYWSGIIDGIYDLIPLIEHNGARVDAGGSVGLPWAAHIGQLAAEIILGLQEVPTIFDAKKIPLKIPARKGWLSSLVYSIWFGLAKITMIRKVRRQ